ncbi:MAG TPA: serine/threonine-protein kinase [Burkholderiales bacterium]
MKGKIKNALPAGYMLRQYQIIRTLGGGGFSIVYVAQDTQRQQKVVIKEYLPTDQAVRGEDTSVQSLSAETDVTFRQGIRRFFDEAAVLARINHPSIVRVLDFFRDNNTVYLVMRYEEGTDLGSYIRQRRGGLSEKFLRTVFPQLLLGLRELHSHNLLHLDIKPPNIFLRPGGKPLLLDFGAAQPAYRDNRLLGAHTLTVGYAPIEQHRRGHLGPWTDLYAIGASMYACINGKAPPAATARAERDKYRPAVRAFAGRYSRQLLEAIDWCLQMDQTERPQTVQQLLEFLEQPVAAETAPAPGVLERLFKLSWLHKKQA